MHHIITRQEVRDKKDGFSDRQPLLVTYYLPG